MLKHGLFYLFAKLTPLLASFILLAVYTRFLSVEDYGLFTTVQAIAYSMSGFMFSWFYVGLMRFWSDSSLDTIRLRSLMNTVLLIVIVLTLSGLGLWAVVSQHFFIALYCGLLFVSAAYYEAFQRVNAMESRSQLYLRAEVSRTILLVILGLIFIYFNYSWQGALIAIFLSNLLVLWQQKFFLNQLKFSLLFDKELLGKILQYGLPLSFSLVFLETIPVIDRLLIAELLDLKAVGQFAIAYNLPNQILMILASSINLAAYPSVIKVLETQGISRAEQKLKDYLILLLAVLSPALLGLQVIAADLYPLLMGKEFVTISLELLPWANLTVFLFILYVFYISLAFQLAKSIRPSLGLVAAAAGLSLIANIMLIPIFNIVGVFIANSLAYALCLIGGYFIGAHYFRLPLPLMDIIKIMLASVIMYLILQALPVHFIPIVNILIKIVLGALCYGLLVYLFNIAQARQKLKLIVGLYLTRYKSLAYLFS
jgi:O-antigen/teichoic acid export membrane protein